MTFDPDYTQSGIHPVRFIATANGLADTQLVDITVTENDRPPVLDPITPPTIAEGDHLQIWLNGRQVADVHDGTTDSGKLGFQIHPGAQFGPMKIVVKELVLKPL